jgi:hypothetical protein
MNVLKLTVTTLYVYTNNDQSFAVEPNEGSILWNSFNDQFSLLYCLKSITPKKIF